MTVFEMSAGHAFQLESNEESVQQVSKQRSRTSVRHVASCTGLRRLSSQRLMSYTLNM